MLKTLKYIIKYDGQILVFLTKIVTKYIFNYMLIISNIYIIINIR